MKKKFYDIVNSNIFIVIVISLCTISTSLWLFNPNNFFIFDDWHNLVQLPQQTFKELMQILPTSSYCSRPVGVIIVKILLNIFGLKYVYHSIFMLALHIINAILVYFLINKIIKNKTIAVVTALIFSMYPVSTVPSYWEAAMFDLVGTTFCLLSTLIYLYVFNLKEKDSKLKYWLLSILMCITYYISLRSKEMFICLPLMLLSYSFCMYIKNKRETKKKFILKEFLKRNINLFIMIMIMIFYAICIKNLNSSNPFTTVKTDAYYYSFDIVGIIKNYYNYLLIYFNPRSLVYDDVIKAVHYSIFYKSFIVIFCISILGYSIYQIRKNNYSYILAIIGYSLFIAPVLPMPNLHAVWYLYIPSIPLAFICADIMYKIIKLFVYKNKIIIVSIVITFSGLLLINKISCVNNYKIWWMDFAGLEYKTYNYFKDLSKEYKDKDIKNVYVINLEEGYTTFFIQHGGIVNVAFDDFDLNVELFYEDDEFDKEVNNDNDLVVDFNNYDFQLIKDVENNDR